MKLRAEAMRLIAKVNAVGAVRLVRLFETMKQSVGVTALSLSVAMTTEISNFFSSFSGRNLFRAVHGATLEMECPLAGVTDWPPVGCISA
jgi:hypothetical protein